MCVYDALSHHHSIYYFVQYEQRGTGMDVNAYQTRLNIWTSLAPEQCEWIEDSGVCRQASMGELPSLGEWTSSRMTKTLDFTRTSWPWAKSLVLPFFVWMWTWRNGKLKPKLMHWISEKSVKNTRKMRRGGGVIMKPCMILSGPSHPMCKQLEIGLCILTWKRSVWGNSRLSITGSLCLVLKSQENLLIFRDASVNLMSGSGIWTPWTLLEEWKVN